MSRSKNNRKAVRQGKESLPIRYLGILASAEHAANFFSKIRLSLDKRIQNTQGQRMLNSWCPAFHDAELCSRYKIRLPHPVHTSPSIPCYQLPFEEMEAFERPETLLKYRPFVILKDYFAAKRFKVILNGGILSTLVYAHDPEKIAGFAEDHFSTTEAVVTDFSNMIRGFWSLEYASDQKVKLPAFYGHLLANDLTKAIKPIELRFRNYVVGKQEDDSQKHIAPRHYILNVDRRAFTGRISLETKRNLFSLVKDWRFYGQCKKNQALFRQKKSEEKVSSSGPD